MTRRTRRLTAVLLFLLLGATGTGTAFAQPGADPAVHGVGGAPGGEAPDVPAGPASLQGRIVHRTGDPSHGFEGITVALFALGADGKPGIRRVQTDGAGNFEFDGISNDPQTVYLLGLRYDGLPFSTRAAFAAGETELVTEIVVSETRASAAELVRGDSELRVDRSCSGVRLTESHALTNPTDDVLFVPPTARATTPPLVRATLPAGAVYFEDLGSALESGLELRDGEVFYWGPIHPGRQSLSFGYSLPAEAQPVRVRRSFPEGATSVRVLTFGDGPTARGEKLHPAGRSEVEGRRYTVVASGPLAAGDSIEFEIDLAPVAPIGPIGSDAAAVRIRSVKTWLELDDAALDVREQFEFEVAGDEALESESDAPLLCLELPKGAEEMRFSNEAFAMGIQPDPTGGLALRGPIPPGTSGFATSYLLRNPGDGIAFERRYPTEVDLLSLFVADTGVLTETDRLHRRRPIRTADRVYINLEAFSIDADETIRVVLTPLPVAKPLPRIAAVGFVVAASLLVGAFLTAPLRAPRRGPEREETLPATTLERAGVYAAIRDLEDDFETGKISEEDHDEMLRELRARAGALLVAERTAQRPAPAEPSPGPGGDARAAIADARCNACDALLPPQARFCAQCGRAVAEGDAGASRL